MRLKNGLRQNFTSIDCAAVENQGRRSQSMNRLDKNFTNGPAADGCYTKDVTTDVPDFSGMIFELVLNFHLKFSIFDLGIKLQIVSKIEQII